MLGLKCGIFPLPKHWKPQAVDPMFGLCFRYIYINYFAAVRYKHHDDFQWLCQCKSPGIQSRLPDISEKIRKSNEDFRQKGINGSRSGSVKKCHDILPFAIHTTLRKLIECRGSCALLIFFNASTPPAVTWTLSPLKDWANVILYHWLWWIC